MKRHVEKEGRKLFMSYGNSDEVMAAENVMAAVDDMNGDDDEEYSIECEYLSDLIENVIVARFWQDQE